MSQTAFSNIIFGLRSAGKIVVLSLGMLAMVVGGCDSLESPLSDESRLVVTSFQEVGKALQPVRFVRAVDVNSAFNPEDAAIRGANVSIALLAADGSVEADYAYRESDENPGVYEAVEQAIVLELRTYRLTITHPDAPRTITSTTLTPGSFEIVRPGLTEVTYQQDPQFVVGVSRSNYPDRQSIFVFSVEALEPSIENLTPLYEEFIDPDSEDNEGLTEEEILEDVLVVNSPPINEGNYEFLADNSIDVKLPWLAVAFYGPTLTSVSAIDQNYYDFIRSQSVQQGGSTLSPGEIPNVINRIDGATGLFAAFSRVEQETLINRE